MRIDWKLPDSNKPIRNYWYNVVSGVSNGWAVSTNGILLLWSMKNHDLTSWVASMWWIKSEMTQLWWLRTDAWTLVAWSNKTHSCVSIFVFHAPLWFSRSGIVIPVFHGHRVPQQRPQVHNSVSEFSALTGMLELALEFLLQCLELGGFFGTSPESPLDGAITI